MRLTAKQLDRLEAVAENGGLWTNVNWKDWPDPMPKWVADQFGMARELVRLAKIGAQVENSK